MPEIPTSSFDCVLDKVRDRGAYTSPLQFTPTYEPAVLMTNLDSYSCIHDVSIALASRQPWMQL